MKNTLIILIFFSPILGLSQGSDSSKLKLSSFEIDYDINNFIGDYNDFELNRFVYSGNDFKWFIQEKHYEDPHEGYGYGNNSIQIIMGVEPFSSKKKEYIGRFEFKIGVNYLKYNKLIIGSRSLNGVQSVDTVNYYDVITDSLTKQIIFNTTNNYEEWINVKSKKVILNFECHIKTNQFKRATFSVAPSLRLGYIFNTSLNYSLFHSYTPVLNNYNGSYPHSKSVVYNGENGISISPYITANAEMLLSDTSHVKNTFSFTFYVKAGKSVNKLGGVDDLLIHNFYGFGVGLKYSL